MEKKKSLEPTQHLGTQRLQRQDDPFQIQGPLRFYSCFPCTLISALLWPPFCFPCTQLTQNLHTRTASCFVQMNEAKLKEPVNMSQKRCRREHHPGKSVYPRSLTVFRCRPIVRFLSVAILYFCAPNKSEQRHDCRYLPTRYATENLSVRF